MLNDDSTTTVAISACCNKDLLVKILSASNPPIDNKITFNLINGKQLSGTIIYFEREGLARHFVLRINNDNEPIFGFYSTDEDIGYIKMPSSKQSEQSYPSAS